MSGFRKAYSVFGVALLAALGLQFYFIAAAALGVWGANDNAKDVYSAFKAGDTFAGLHAINGTFLVPLIILILVGLSFAARHDARIRWQTAALFGLMVLQFVLALLGFSSSRILVVAGGLHGVNALALVGFTVSLAYRTWAFGGAASKQGGATARPANLQEPAPSASSARG